MYLKKVFVGKNLLNSFMHRKKWIASNLTIFFLTILLLIFALVAIKTGIMSKKDVSQPEQGEKNNIVVKNPSKSDSWDWSSADKPEDGRLYITADKNEKGVYYTTEEIRKGWGSGSSNTKPYYGTFIGFDSGMSMEGFYHFLKDPKPFKHDFFISNIDQVIVDASKNFAYTSMYAKFDLNSLPERGIYQVDIKNMTVRKIWVDRFVKSNEGVVRMESINNKYIILTVYTCYECEGGIHGRAILNVVNGKDLYLADVGELNIDIKNNKVSYQKMFEVSEKCLEGESYGCTNGVRIIKKPLGEIYSQPLP